jgi:hypothetical protein
MAKTLIRRKSMNEEPKKRGIFLTIWIVLIILVNAIYLISAVQGAMSPEAVATSLGISASTFQMYAIGLGLLNLIGIIGAVLVYLWKKIGLWLMVGAVVVSIVLSLIGGMSLIPGLILAIMVVILAILIWPKMKSMS